MRCRTSSLIVTIVLACLTFSTQAVAQGARSGVPMVLRAQAGSIVEEAWHHLADSAHRSGDIWITVEGGSAKRIVENALLEFLSQHGFRPQLGRQLEGRVEGIQVTVLEQVVQYELLKSGESQREIRTVMEMRRTSARDNVAVYGGPYQRRAVDTVSVRDDGGLADLRNAEDPSFVDRIMGPVLLIGGAFLVVYLFFTVRN